MDEFGKFLEGRKLIGEAGFRIKEVYVSKGTMAKMRTNTFVDANEYGYVDFESDGMFLGIKLFEEVKQNR